MNMIAVFMNKTNNSNRIPLFINNQTKGIRKLKNK